MKIAKFQCLKNTTANTYLSEFEFWAKKFKIHKGTKNLVAYLYEIKSQINEFVMSKKYKILFIIDNVKLEDEALNVFKVDFDREHIKFLFTSKSPHLSKNFQPVLLTLFNETNCINYIRKRGIAIPSYRGDEKQWKELLKLIGFENCVLPLKLLKLVSKVIHETQWKFKNIKEHFSNSIEHNYGILQIEKPLAFEILSYTAYLSVTNISFNLIKTIFNITPYKININLDTDLKDALLYLCN